MSHETLFTLINAFVLPFWLLLLIAPFSKPTRWLVHSGVVPLVLGLPYIVCLFFTSDAADDRMCVVLLAGLFIATDSGSVHPRTAC